MELQAIVLNALQWTVIVTVSAVVTDPPWVLGMLKVYCPFPAVPENDTPVSVPDGVVTVKSRSMVLVPTPERLTRKLSEPAATLKKDLGESPVKVNTVTPITADVWAPVEPRPVSMMPPPVEEPVFVPDRPIGFANAGVANRPEIVSNPIIPKASFVAVFLFVLFSPRRGFRTKVDIKEV
jgi:hypothetical protein